MSKNLRVGAIGQRYVLDLERDPEDDDEDPFDYLTVTGAILHVRLPGGRETTWPVDQISRQTATTIRLTHITVAGDLPERGPYIIYADLTTPTEIIPSFPCKLFVPDKFTVLNG